MTPRRLIPAALAVTALALAIWFGLLAPNRDRDGLDVSGTVEATEALLGFQVPGRIEAVLVSEGDAVSAGQELARLDRTELAARVAGAQAQARAARAMLSELERGYRPEELAQARAALRGAEQRRVEAEREQERSRRLYEGGAISRQAFEQAETAATVAETEREQAKEQLALLEAGPRRERIEAQRAAVLQAEAAVSQAEASLTNAVIVAPFTGIVTVRHREPGETAPAGGAVVTLMNPNDRWVRIYLRGDIVGRAALGQLATITADAYRDRTYSGEVAFIAREAEFTPRNVQTAEERVKLVYAVKVRITGDSAFDLKPGLAADVRLAPRE